MVPLPRGICEIINFDTAAFTCLCQLITKEEDDKMFQTLTIGRCCNSFRYWKVPIQDLNNNVIPGHENHKDAAIFVEHSQKILLVLQDRVNLPVLILAG